jgi:aspartate/methionine/tyrosine aminotransferase
MIHVLGANSVGYPVDLQRGTISSDEIEPLVSEKTKAVIVNSPNNPTGAVYSSEALESLAAVCARHDLWLISDECYDELVYDSKHVSVAAVAPSERVITVFSFSKTYAMTGWRVGYVVASRDFTSELLKEQEPVHGNASSVSQKAAEAALLGSQEAVGGMRDTYQVRRSLAIQRLDDANVRYLTPEGAFYIIVDVCELGSTMDAARSLLELDHVSVVPGAAFGPRGEGWARVSLCAPDEALENGLQRIVNRLASR